MANPPLPKALALDSNVILDLAAEEGFAHDLLRGCRSKKIALAVSPTVVQELVYKARNIRADAAKRVLATTGLIKLRREWGISPFDLVAVGHGITDEFAKCIIRRRLLPEEEINDGLILAETAIAGLSGLVTSDHHLLDINPSKLKEVFKDRDLDPVTIYKAKHLSKLVT